MEKETKEPNKEKKKGGEEEVESKRETGREKEGKKERMRGIERRRERDPLTVNPMPTVAVKDPGINFPWSYWTSREVFPTPLSPTRMVWREGERW